MPAPPADDDPTSKLAGNRPKRCTESRTLESKAFRDFIERLRNNTLECDAGGKVLRLKRFISSTAGPKVLNEVLEALKHNTKVEALYIQNFEEGFYDEQLEKLTEVLKLKRIWCLNVGENFRTTLPAWRAFAKELPETAVSHMYASEHHFIGTDVKNQMKDAIRETRKANVVPHSLEVITACGNMWYNPKLPKWARDMKGGTAALLARQQAASADSSVCAVTGASPGSTTGTKNAGGPGGGGARRAAKLGSDASRDIESFLRDKRSQFRDGKRTVVQTQLGAAHAKLEADKRKRGDKRRRERLAAKRRDDDARATAEKNEERVAAAVKARGGAALVGWKVRVFWPAEKAWFYGVVEAFDAQTGKHSVVYEDGDEQNVSLTKRGVDVGFLRAPRNNNADGTNRGGSGRAKGEKKTIAPASPSRKSARTPKRRAESPPPPPGGLRGSHGIRAAAAARRLSETLAKAPKRARSARG